MPSSESELAAARERLLAAALAVIATEIAPGESADSAASAEYADEQLAHAARDLVRATDALPAGRQPVGWTDTPPGYAGTL